MDDNSYFDKYDQSPREDPREDRRIVDTRYFYIGEDNYKKFGMAHPPVKGMHALFAVNYRNCHDVLNNDKLAPSYTGTRIEDEMTLAQVQRAFDRAIDKRNAHYPNAVEFQKAAQEHFHFTLEIPADLPRDPRIEIPEQNSFRPGRKQLTKAPKP